MSKTNHDQSLRVSDSVTAVSIMAFFVLSALIIGWFGVKDMFNDSTAFNVVLRAVAMVAESLYLLVSAAAVVLVLRNRSAAAGAVALIGSTVSAITGAMLVGYQLIDGDPTPWLAAWLGMATGGAFVTVRLLRAGAGFPYPKQFAVAVTVTGLLTGANFAYTTLYQPTTEPTQLKAEIDIGAPTVNTEMTFASIPIKISILNTGKRSLHVLAANYNVMGRSGRITNTDQTVQEMNLEVQHGLPASPRATVSGYSLIQTDKFIPAGYTYGPGERDDIKRVVYLPLPTKYDAIALEATVLVVREADVSIDMLPLPTYSWDQTSGAHLVDAPQWLTKLTNPANRGVDFERYEFPVVETNYLREHTRRKWTGTVWRVFGDPNSYLMASFGPKESPPDVDQKVVDQNNLVAFKRYGAGIVYSGLQEKSIHEMKLERTAGSVSEPTAGSASGADDLLTTILTWLNKLAKNE